MSNEELKRLLKKTTASVDETASAVDFSEKQIRQAISAGLIPVIKLGPRKHRIPTTWIAMKLGVDMSAA